MILTLFGFLLCAAIIFFSGTKLAYCGDQIAEITGMGKAWFGLIMMASVTSLPELFVGISSARIIESADFAVGDILGSCAFNLAILSLLDVFSKKTTLFSIAAQSHVLAGALGIVLFSFVGIGLFVPYDFKLIDWIGISSIVFIVIYLISIKLVYQYEKNHPTPNDPSKVLELQNKTSLKKVVLWYALNALVVIGAALLLPYFAENLSNQTGLNKSFTGTVLLAASTSLPEVAVSVAAIRMGAIDMAVGNLLGSNLFNIFILAIGNFFYRKGHILVDASESNIISVFSIITMTAIAIIGLTYRSKNKLFFLAWDTLLIVIMFVFNMIILYKLQL
jgi:cation:H+ antiporter